MWGQCEVLRILRRYRPQTEDELFDILSLLDASLVSHQPAVMAATLGLFLSLSRALPSVRLAALDRARGPLLAACGSTSTEMRFTALCHIQVSRRRSSPSGRLTNTNNSKQPQQQTTTAPVEETDAHSSVNVLRSGFVSFYWHCCCLRLSLFVDS